MFPFRLSYLSSLCSFNEEDLQGATFICPGRYPNLWVLPNNAFFTKNGTDCYSLAECRNQILKEESDESLLDLLNRNFYFRNQGETSQSFNGYWQSRQPISLVLDQDYFKQRNLLDIQQELIDLLSEWQSHNNVFFVSPKPVVDWMGKQFTTQRLHHFLHGEEWLLKERNCAELDQNAVKVMTAISVFLALLVIVTAIPAIVIAFCKCRKKCCEECSDECFDFSLDGCCNECYIRQAARDGEENSRYLTVKLETEIESKKIDCDLYSGTALRKRLTATGKIFSLLFLPSIKCGKCMCTCACKLEKLQQLLSTTPFLIYILSLFGPVYLLTQYNQKEKGIDLKEFENEGYGLMFFTVLSACSLFQLIINSIWKKFYYCQGLTEIRKQIASAWNEIKSYKNENNEEVDKNKLLMIPRCSTFDAIPL
eukprot:m.128951 g.128951  ORF g.128951 m.128951 type:complete len:424 (+) comp37959_c0_seq3:698-1969(+)